MKNRILTSVLGLLLVLSAIFVIDYVLIAFVGIIASMFNVSALFYEKVYPYVIALIISASIAYPLTAVLLKRKNKVMDKVHTLFSHKHQIEGFRKSA